MIRPRTLAILISAAAVLAPATPASAASFVARLRAPNHSPKAGTKHWVITVTARTSSGRALRATAVYQFLYNGQRVSTQYPNPGHSTGGRHPYAFTGRYRDAILWPRRAAGYPLTLRVVVSVRGRGSRNLDWAVRVRR